MMYVLEYLIYHLRPYGIASYLRPEDQKLLEYSIASNNNKHKQNRPVKSVLPNESIDQLDGNQSKVSQLKEVTAAAKSQGKSKEASGS